MNIDDEPLRVIADTLPSPIAFAPSLAATMPVNTTPFLLLPAPPSVMEQETATATQPRTNAEWMQPSEYRAASVVSRSAESVVDSCVDYVANMWEHLERREARVAEERHPDPVVRFWRRARKVAQVAAMACDKLAHKMERRHEQRVIGLPSGESHHNGSNHHAFALFTLPREWQQGLHPRDHALATERIMHAATLQSNTFHPSIHTTTLQQQPRSISLN